MTLVNTTSLITIDNVRAQRAFCGVLQDLDDRMPDLVETASQIDAELTKRLDAEAADREAAKAKRKSALRRWERKPRWLRGPAPIDVADLWCQEPRKRDPVQEGLKVTRQKLRSLCRIAHAAEAPFSVTRGQAELMVRWENGERVDWLLSSERAAI